jgi:hypothetical protein
MKMIAHHRQEQVRLTIDKTLTIPVMAIIKESSEILFYFQSNQGESDSVGSVVTIEDRNYYWWCAFMLLACL